MESSKTKMGPPRKISERIERWMVRKISRGDLDYATQLVKPLKNDMGVQVSARTIGGSLKRQGLRSSKKIKKPRISPKNKEEPLRLPIEHKEWTMKDWKQVMWSDETKIKRIGWDGRQWVWKRPSEPMTGRSIQPTIKFRGGSLMMWGCMTAKGVGYATRVDGGMDAQLYVRILEDELQETIDYYDLDRRTIIFHQDNDRKHTANITQECFKKKGIKLLKWPSHHPT